MVKKFQSTHYSDINLYTPVSPQPLLATEVYAKGGLLVKILVIPDIFSRNRQESTTLSQRVQ